MTEPLKDSFFIEPERRTDILFDVDVAVAGCGLSGVFAALAAARHGAKTLVIDRFGSVGGHLGPGMVLAAGLTEWGPERTFGADLPHMVKELIAAVEKETTSTRVEDPYGTLYYDQNFPRLSNRFSHEAQELLERAGVQFLYSSYAADPFLRNRHVHGLFVETKSGRKAVRSKVTIDATGDADLAARAGLPVIKGTAMKSAWQPLVYGSPENDEYSYWNDGGLLYVVGGVDWKAFYGFAKQEYELSTDEHKWWKEAIGAWGRSIPPIMIPCLKKAADTGEYFARSKLVDKAFILGGFSLKGGHEYRVSGDWGSTSMQVYGEVDTGDAVAVSRIEKELRKHIFRTVAFYKNHVPGFGGAYVLFISPYFGSRGGRCIDGEYTLTPDDILAGRKFPDVIYTNVHERERLMTRGEGQGVEAYDVPFRILQPRNADGLLVAGTGAAFLRRGHDPSSMRAKCSMMALGHAAGVAAALSVKQEISPKNLDVKAYQRVLLSDGFHLGDGKRLKELGLM